MVIADASTRRLNGFSLIELMVALAIIGIVMAFGAPAIRDLLANQRMKSAAFNLLTTSMYARSEAIKRGLPIYITGATANDLTDGWCVLISSTATCSLTAPDPATMRVSQPVSGVTYSFISTAGSIAFNRSGRLTSQVQVEIVDNELSGLKRCVTIDVGGNARSVVGACS